MRLTVTHAVVAKLCVSWDDSVHPCLEMHEAIQSKGLETVRCQRVGHLPVHGPLTKSAYAILSGHERPAIHNQLKATMHFTTPHQL